MSVGNLKPYDLVTTAEVSDGEGGWLPGAPQVTGTVFLDVQFHETETTALARVDSEVLVDQVVLVDGGSYRIMEIQRRGESLYKTLVLEKVDLPVEPA